MTERKANEIEALGLVMWSENLGMPINDYQALFHDDFATRNLALSHPSLEFERKDENMFQGVNLWWTHAGWLVKSI